METKTAPETKQIKCERTSDGFFKYCVAMDMCLHPEANAYVKGLIQLNVFSFKTGESRVAGVAYRTASGQKAKSIMLNVCPWCKEDISPQKRSGL